MNGIARSTISATALAAKWNKQFPVATRVRYWLGKREGAGKCSITITQAEVLNGHTAVIWVAAEGGCIALSHVEPEPTPEGGAA